MLFRPPAVCGILLSQGIPETKRRTVNMNTDKIYAEQLANEYAPKDTSKVVALRKLDRRANLPATVLPTPSGLFSR